MEKLDDLSEHLLEPGETWTGMSTDANDKNATRSIDQVLRSPNRPWAGRFWQAELARGTFSEMDTRTRAGLDFIFKQSGDVEVH
jgi:hypothetical protein